VAQVTRLRTGYRCLMTKARWTDGIRHRKRLQHGHHGHKDTKWNVSENAGNPDRPSEGIAKGRPTYTSSRCPCFASVPEGGAWAWPGPALAWPEQPHKK
jgi:hypothetical protein